MKLLLHPPQQATLRYRFTSVSLCGAAPPPSGAWKHEAPHYLVIIHPGASLSRFPVTGSVFNEWCFSVFSALAQAGERREGCLLVSASRPLLVPLLSVSRLLRLSLGSDCYHRPATLPYLPICWQREAAPNIVLPRFSPAHPLCCGAEAVPQCVFGGAHALPVLGVADVNTMVQPLRHRCPAWLASPQPA